MEALEDKITKASKSTNARFKRKKIRSMKREADKIAEKLQESEAALKLLEPRVPKAPSGVPLKLHPPSRNKHMEAKIAELNKKIRRAKNRRNKECLMHQSIPSTNIPPGDPQGFALYCCPGARIYT